MMGKNGGKLIQIESMIGSGLLNMQILPAYLKMEQPACVYIACTCMYVVVGRDDYKFSEMIRQKPMIATLVPNLIGHPYIALERQCLSGRALSKMA